MSRRATNIIVAVAIPTVWLLWLVGIVLHGNGTNVLSWLGISSYSYEKAGQFGDSFGPLSALMAALAAVGVWFAFRQSQDQAFESTFYSLLAHHNSIVESTDIVQKTKEKHEDGTSELKTGDNFQGRDAFRRMLRLLRSTVAGMKDIDELDRVSRGYRRFHDRYEDELAHYFRTIYHIVLFVEKSKIQNKDLYFRIIRAQLSNSEQVLLLYNVTVGYGFWKFRRIVEDRSLLHNIHFNEESGLWEERTLKPLLSGKAFRQADAEQWPSRDDLEKKTSTEAGRISLFDKFKNSSMFNIAAKPSD